MYSPYLFRLTFRDFLDLASGDRVPDARTKRTFKEGLTRNVNGYMMKTSLASPQLASNVLTISG